MWGERSGSVLLGMEIGIRSRLTAWRFQLAAAQRNGLGGLKKKSVRFQEANSRVSNAFSLAVRK
jgi:hypothetical protein